MISLLVVNYRSAVLAAAAIRTARAASSAPLQVVAVDNSCDVAEEEALRGIADELVVSATNRGYAAAINAGRRVCEGDSIVISNADVAFAPGAIDELRGALDHAAVAGPALFWDDAHRWMLPPGDLGTGIEKLDEVLAGRSRAWFEERDRRRFRKRLAFWSLQKTTEVPMLSGAVMAVRAGDFDSIGGFDERFPLYFEETDFLRRVTEARRRIVYVPAARVRHLYNQSASQVAAEAAARYAQSELRYLEKWNGPFAARLLKRIERPLPAYDAAPLDGRNAIDGPIQLDRDDLVVEASPLPSFSTAAGHFTESRQLELPPEVYRALRSELYLRIVVRNSGEVLATYRISA